MSSSSNVPELLTEVEVEREETQVPAVVAIEQSRAIQEIQAALIIAKKFPRDENISWTKISKSCSRLTLAEQAVYLLPVGGQKHEGPSIRLAEVLAQAWGNIRYGIKELSRDKGRSHCVAYCLDLETNTSVELEFAVDHWIEIGKAQNKSKKIITDPIEVDRLIANRGARKVRNCILNVIPGDVIDDAVKKCKQTMAKGDGEPLSTRIRKMVAAFTEQSVTQQMIEERLGHAIDSTTGEEVADLIGIYKAIVDKQAKRSDFFNTGEVEASRKSSLADKLKGVAGETQELNS